MHRTPFLLAALCLTLTSPAIAQTEVAPPQAPSFAAIDDEHLRGDIESSLKQGRYYLRAIQAAQEYIKRNPKSAQAQLLLGCACASRFASLSVALSQVENDRNARTRYEEKKATWEKAQQEADPTGPPPPVPPPPAPLVTLDDGRLFTIRQGATRQQLLLMAWQAINAFEAARTLSETAPVAQQVQCEQTRGWGLFLLRRYGSEILREGPISKNVANKDDPTKPPANVYVAQSDITESFEKASRLAPDNVSCLHSLALSLVPNRVLEPSPSQPTEKLDNDRAIQLMDKALALTPRDFDLLYQAAVLTAPVDAARSVEYLNRALQRQGTNAVVWYLLADCLFKQARQQSGQPDKSEALAQKAKSALANGNGAPLYQSVPFALPVPAYLKSPWRYRPVYGGEPDTLIAESLLVALEKRVAMAKGNDEAEQLSDATLVMNLGLRQIGSIEDSQISNTDSTRILHLKERLSIGTALCLYAYDFLSKYPSAKPSQAYTDLLEQYDLLRKQVDARTNDYLHNAD